MSSLDFPISCTSILAFLHPISWTSILACFCTPSVELHLGVSVGDWIRKAHLVFRVQFEAMGKKAGAKKKVKEDSADVAEQSHEPMDKSEISAMLGYLKYHAAKTTPTGSLAKNALEVCSQCLPACKRKFLADFKKKQEGLVMDQSFEDC